jgi:hypothetical protein
MNFPDHKPLLLAGAVLFALAMTGPLAPRPVDAAPSTLVVPTMYSTIQSAVDAANPGDRIQVRRGTYVEQVSIDKDLEIVGAGAGSTIIRAPATLVPGQHGRNTIVEIRAGASASLSRLTVSGPGSGTCEQGALYAGILVFDGADLDLSFARVTQIHDTPLQECFRSGIGIRIGHVGTAATATIRSSRIDGYQTGGIVVIFEGSRATISHNVVTGQGASPVVATDGIEVIAGAVGTVSHNVVSGNACGSAALGCGPDFFTEFQHAGIVADGAGTVITRNVLSRNQVGIYVANAVEISHNLFLNNDYFGIALQDGSFAVNGDIIVGGVGGVAVIAAFADTNAVLDNVHIAGTSGPAVQEFECCGFTATTTGGP